ncbi:TPA: hypothetical protein ACKFJT_007302, partial [Burkholderia cenocepacia]
GATRRRVNPQCAGERPGARPFHFRAGAGISRGEGKSAGGREPVPEKQKARGRPRAFGKQRV